MKIVLGLLLGVLIGAGCRLLEIPLPAPQALNFPRLKHS
jgi:XapX domain-containing protein